MKENIQEQWGETVNGIIEALEQTEEVQIFNCFDPYLNEYLEKLDDFISNYIPKDNIKIEDVNLDTQIKRVKVDCARKGLYTAKIFMKSLFTEKEAENFQNFIKKLYEYRNELYEFTSFCEVQNPDSETNKILKEYENSKTLRILEEVKRRYILIGFLLCNPKLLIKKCIRAD